MKNNIMKRIFSVSVISILLLTSLAACSSSRRRSSTSSYTPRTSTPRPTTSFSSATAPPPNQDLLAGKERVVFWHNNQGDEIEVMNSVVKMYNDSQDKYVVEAVSVTDKQRVSMSMTGDGSPDVIGGSNQDVISYQANRLIENISGMADADGYDLTAFSEKSMQANTIDGALYALPTTSIVIQMFYNIDLLNEAGYSEPPKTMEELYEMALAITKLDDNGDIETLGYPLFPFASARQELNYAFGGRWWAEDLQTLTPDSPGILDSLNMNVAYRSQYGIEQVQSFASQANANRYTENDMFFNGKQAFRFDGVWLPTMMESFNSEVNYGVTLIPGTQANPDSRGSSRFETNSLCIPAAASNKEGAWDFIKWLANSEGTKVMLNGLGNLPALKILWDDEELLAKPGFAGFIEALKEEKGIQYATISDLDKYNALIDEHLGYVYSGVQTPEEAMSNLVNKVAELH